MNQLLHDWENFCEGNLDTCDSHFLGLFKSYLTDQELKRALRYFPSPGLIEERLRNVLGAGYLGEYIYLQRPRMTDIERTTRMARAWLDERAEFCRELGEMELVQLAAGAQILFVDEAEYERVRYEDNPEGRIGDHITDEVFMPLGDAPRTTFALIEAAYGIAADSCLGWYIAQPLLKIKLDFSKYFEFWRSGGAGVLTERGFLIRKSGR